MNFKVGDKVKIKDDIGFDKLIDKDYKDDRVNWYQKKNISKTGTVTKVFNDGDIKAKFNDAERNCYYYRSEWLELIDTKEEKIEAPRLKIGDKVRVIVVPPEDNNPRIIWVNSMDKYCGQEGIITDVDNDGDLELTVDDKDYWWHPDWLEIITDEQQISEETETPQNIKSLINKYWN